MRKSGSTVLFSRAMLLAGLATPLVFASAAWADTAALSTLDLTKLHQDWGQPRADRSVDNHPLTIAGQTFEKGVGTHAGSIFFVQLDGKASQFTAKVGVDDEIKDNVHAKDRPVEFKVICDGRVMFRSGPMIASDAARPVQVSLNGVQQMVLVARAVGPDLDSAHADWVDASIDFAGAAPVATAPPAEEREVLTPKAPNTPRINGAKVVGVRLGHPLLYGIAATGDRPMQFSAEGLPAGVSLDAATGQITGSVAAAGTHRIKIKATNALGSAEAELRIEVGDKIALTPPMGWNSWNCFAADVSDAKVRAAADAMVSSGLVNHGWTYINIDDCWQVKTNQPMEKRRTPAGRVITNDKFPDMKALADYVHGKGLRAGLYSSPGRGTCAGYDGSYQFEAEDAKQYAEWGFDYLKYDWCQYNSVAEDMRHSPHPPSPLEILQHPYSHMHEELAKQNRDIVYSLCQYGWGNVWEWGAQVGGTCWRTTGDINDSWGSMAGIGFNQNGHEKFAGPGHWNDPDMLVVGKVGWGPSLHPTKLTPNEQYTHISLWSLLASPLLIGCDMTQMDDFTLGLLTNDEVIAVNQDPLGQQAHRVLTTDDDTEIWMKDLEDGSKAVGLFNRSEVAQSVTVKWDDLGVSGLQTIRDLWRQKSLGQTNGGFAATVGRHGVVLIKVSPVGRPAK